MIGLSSKWLDLVLCFSLLVLLNSGSVNFLSLAEMPAAFGSVNFFGGMICPRVMLPDSPQDFPQRCARHRFMGHPM
jgi:hypothetical protein